MKKQFLLLILLLLIPSMVFAEGLPTGSFSTNADSNITYYNYVQKAFRSKSMTSPFIENFSAPLNLRTNDGTYPLYLLSKNHEVPYSSDPIDSANSKAITDDGILYIISYGFNVGSQNESIFDTKEFGEVTEDSLKEYLTQIALWVYIYQNKSKFSDTYCYNGGCDFTNSDGTLVSATEVYDLIAQGATFNKYGSLNYIIKLVDNAKIYKSQTSTLSSISGDTLEYEIDKKNHILTTKLIRPTPTGNSTNYVGYSISLEDPNQYGVYFTNENDEIITDISSYQGAFHLVVPLQDNLDNMNLNSIKLHIKGYFLQSRAYECVATLAPKKSSNGLSPILYGNFPLEEVDNDYSIQNFVKISTLDPKNTLLAGATMVLTKKDDPTFSESWISGEDAHFLQLRNGEYTLCETKAPNGYEACTECVDFKVDGENVTVLDVKNEQKVPIPNTSMFSNKVVRNIGIILLVIGILVIGFSYLSNENKA